MTLLNDLLFHPALHSAGQGRPAHSVCASCTINCGVQRSEDIGQTACGDHSTANGELLAEDNVQPRLLFWQAEGGNVLNAQSDIIRFLQLQIASSLCD